VANALLILLVFTSVYAVLGTHLFKDKSSMYFGNFASSLFTMFQGEEALILLVHFSTHFWRPPFLAAPIFGGVHFIPLVHLLKHSFFMCICFFKC